MIARFGWLIFLTAVFPAAAQEPSTGPETEKRFPPLKLADGFEAQLFACDPLVEYPSVIALGPRPGTLFVAQDYMTGLGKEIVKRDEIRLIEDSDGDGYADKTTLFAKGFNSIQGLAYDIGDGTVFAMHAPFLTMVRDTDGDGVADERRDLLEGLGLRPEENDTRLHTANGVTVGHDNWLYLALGDHGAKIDRPEGDRLVLEGGGILRCRPDGSELHIFSTGLRNIYDVALDADLNVFVRDNENDGGDYKIRVYHSFFGADHGYPYKYYERPEETMLPLADLDLGSSAGGVCYLETAFPEEYRGNLFFCDWNHSLVRYEVKPKGASFEPMEEFKVAEGGEGDLYPFKPSDVIVDWDGSLLVSDWADGQRPKRGRARIYRITHRDGNHEVAADPTEDLSGRSLEELIGQMDSESYFARVLAQKEMERRGSRYHDLKLPRLPDLFEAVFALNDWNSSPEQVRTFPEVLLSAGIIESRHELVEDPAFQHSVIQGLRRSKNSGAVLKFLDLPDNNPFRSIAIRALGDQAEVEIVDALINRVETGHPEYVDLLARVHRKPGPWVYWEYRPAPRSPNTVDWERTGAIEKALDRILEFSRDAGLRRYTLERMQREKIPVRIETLSKWLESERDAESVALILNSLHENPAAEVATILEAIVRDADHAAANRLTALEQLGDSSKLRTIAESLEDGPVLAAILRQAKVDLEPLLFKKVGSSSAEVRAAAIATLGERKVAKAAEAVVKLLADPDPGVREAAASAARMIPVPSAADRLIELAANDGTAAVRRESFDALRAIENGEAVSAAVRDLQNRETQLAAMRYLNAFGNPEHAADVVKSAGTNRSSALLDAAIGALVKWESDEEIARLQGRSGILLRWKFSDPIASDSADKLPAELRGDSALPSDWRIATASGPDSIVRPPPVENTSSRFLVTDVTGSAETETPIQFLAGCSGPFQMWLNGNPVFEQSKAGAFQPDAHRINAVLKPGNNRVVLRIDSAPEAKFHLKFRKRSSVAAREELTQAALTGRGNALRGKQLFFNLERSQCLACHRLGDQGGKIGPELTGMGGRFSRIYLIESILDPNANVTPGFKSLAITRKDGSALFGVKVSETETAIVVGDAAGQPHEIPKADIAEIKEPNISLMPAGLENLYTRKEFLDLIAFLISER